MSVDEVMRSGFADALVDLDNALAKLVYIKLTGNFSGIANVVHDTENAYQQVITFMANCNLSAAVKEETEYTLSITKAMLYG